MPEVELSLVIPVYNGSETIAPLVDRIHELFPDMSFEVVLVNDGSKDASEEVCAGLVDTHPKTVRLLQLARNFGEHNAVMAGLNETRGKFVAVLDDDGQNPPEEVVRMLAAIKDKGSDVVYGHYSAKKHSWFRNLGSRFNDKMANVMLGKPPEIYLSSFKLMNRFLVDEVIRYHGAFPYIDGLIFRSTSNIEQIVVEHRQRERGSSNYTLWKLIKLWMNMFLNFSIAPLRLVAICGFLTALLGLILIVGIVVEKLWIHPAIPVGWPSTLVLVVFFAGVQLFILGAIGEYLGRMFLDVSGNPQFVVRYKKEG